MIPNKIANQVTRRKYSNALQGKNYPKILRELKMQLKLPGEKHINMNTTLTTT